MKYKVTVGNLGIDDANRFLRLCSEIGCGVPEISEIAESIFMEPIRPVTHHPKFRRKEIVVTAVAPDGKTITGNSVEVAEFIRQITGHGVSPSNMMVRFRAGEKYHAFTGVIASDSHRVRKSKACVTSAVVPQVLLSSSSMESEAAQ